MSSQVPVWKHFLYDFGLLFEHWILAASPLLLLFIEVIIRAVWPAITKFVAPVDQSFWTSRGIFKAVMTIFESVGFMFGTIVSVLQIKGTGKILFAMVFCVSGVSFFYGCNLQKPSLAQDQYVINNNSSASCRINGTNCTIYNDTITWIEATRSSPGSGSISDSGYIAGLVCFTFFFGYLRGIVVRNMITAAKSGFKETAFNFLAIFGDLGGLVGSAAAFGIQARFYGWGSG
jgi:hypothetical protein